MPAATTHYLFSLDAYKNLDTSIKEKITNLNMFYLGSQGPDIFFFHKAGLTKDSLNHVGSILHCVKVYDTIQSFFKYAKEDADLLSYIYGFITHYALDSNAHPLVIYGSRHFNNPKESEGENHCRIESYIDTYMLYKKGLTKKDYIVHKATKISKEDARKLAKMFQTTLKEVHNIDVSQDDLMGAIKDTTLFLTLMKPNLKLKYIFFRMIEKMFVGGKAVCTSIMLFNEDLKRTDEILNFERNEFSNPVDSSIRYNYSFDDCYANGLNTFAEIVKNPLNKDLYKVNFEGNKYE